MEHDDIDHKVTITIFGKYPHGDKEHASVTINGSGDLDHMIDAFKAFLVAAGFSIKAAESLTAAKP